MELFDGYILSNGKVPLNKIIGGDYLLEPPGKGDYVGVLKKEIVQIDFDDEESSKIALAIVEDLKLRCDILKTTRGIHLYFLDDGNVKSQSVGIFNAIGLTCDIGLGSKNRVVPLRTTKEIETTRIVDGKEVVERTCETTTREFIQTYSELDVLPIYFRPLDRHDFGIKESNARNQTLFTYILKLQTFNFNKDEIRKIIRVINKYILYEPLDDRQIDTITRDDAFSQEIFFNEKGTFLHDRFGNYMLTNSNVLNIEGNMCIYTNDNIYSYDPNDFERTMVSKISHLKETQRKEVYKYMNLKCSHKGEYADPKYIGLKDSILDIETMEKFPYSPLFVMNNKIDFDYKADSYSELVDKTLNKVCCNDPEIRALLEEMIGYTLYRANSMQVCFILTGEGSNGKSTILNMIKRLLGKPNFTSLSMQDLEDTFRPAELYNKLANIGDDISPKYLEDSSIFKKVVTGESIMVAKKYAQPFEMESYACQIFSANQLPSVNDKTDGFNRRITIIPFGAKFSSSDSDYDPFIESKLLTDESIEYLLKIAIDGLKRVIINRGFTKSSKGQKEKDDYVISNNNCLEFMSENPKIENEAVNDVYLVYRVWCEQSGYKPVRKGNLSKEIRKELGLVSRPRYVDGKTIRVYEKED